MIHTRYYAFLELVAPEVLWESEIADRPQARRTPIIICKYHGEPLEIESTVNIQRSAEKVLGPDENIFRID